MQWVRKEFNLNKHIDFRLKSFRSGIVSYWGSVKNIYWLWQEQFVKTVIKFDLLRSKITKKRKKKRQIVLEIKF